MIRNMIAGCMTIGLLAVGAAAQTTSGTISSDETWNGTVTVTGDVVITDATLTVSPGTTVRFATTNDNRVNGGAATIHLIIRDGGAVAAEGTEAQPVLFTTSSPFKNPGMWGEIDIMEDIDVANTGFRHCTFECGGTMMDFRSSSHTSIRATSAIVIEDCVFRKSSAAAVYVTSGGSPTIRRCTFTDCRSTSVFGHGAGTITMEHCTISDVSVGIIAVGEPDWGWPQVMNLDHLTVYDVHGDKATTATWWTGHGIYCSGSYSQRGTMTLTNSIIADVFWQGNFTSGLYVGQWDVANDYNCWYEAGSAEVNGGDVGTHAVEADPLFAVPSDPSQGLLAGSPCLDEADDGTHMGAWQGTPVSAVRPRPAEDPPPGFRTGNPVRGRADFTFDTPSEGPVRLDVMTPAGVPVTHVTAGTGARGISWEIGTVTGTHIYRLIINGAVRRGIILVR